ncbi:MAG: hypothetical protein ABEJ66_00045, partial [Candidatus Nanohaloarchaea archaeon]
EGRVPHLTRAMETGVYGNLTTIRAFSPVTWTKIASGMRSDDVKVSGWNVRKPDGTIRMIQSKDVERKRIWDYLNDANISTGVVGCSPGLWSL